MAPTQTRKDVYQEITDKIVAQLEQGVRPWLRPWGSADHPAGSITRPLRANGETYKGINVLMLWASADTQGFACPIWMTYKQAQELGAQVEQGSKGTQVVFASSIKKTDQKPDGTLSEHDIFFMRSYTVFNCEQIRDLPGHYYAKSDAPTLSEDQRIQRAEAFFQNTEANIQEGGNRAFYRLNDDSVHMPPFAAFHSPESYAATLAHELTHWTGHATRCDRTFGKKFGTDDYAKEELVAEIGSAFLCCDLKITPEVREDHAAYLKSWLSVLKADKRAIFQAASSAQRAVDFLHSLQPERSNRPIGPVNQPSFHFHENEI